MLQNICKSGTVILKHTTKIISQCTNATAREYLNNSPWYVLHVKYCPEISREAMQLLMKIRLGKILPLSGQLNTININMDLWFGFSKRYFYPEGRNDVCYDANYIDLLKC